jgi:hypothetical protein
MCGPKFCSMNVSARAMASLPPLSEAEAAASSS